MTYIEILKSETYLHVVLVILVQHVFIDGSENEEAKAQLQYIFLYFQLFLTVVLYFLNTHNFH